MSGWTALASGLAAATGAIGFLAIVAHEIGRVTSELDRCEELEDRALKQRLAQEAQIMEGPEPDGSEQAA